MTSTQSCEKPPMYTDSGIQKLCKVEYQQNSRSNIKYSINSIFIDEKAIADSTTLIELRVIVKLTSVLELSGL